MEATRSSSRLSPRNTTQALDMAATPPAGQVPAPCGLDHFSAAPPTRHEDAMAPIRAPMGGLHEKASTQRASTTAAGPQLPSLNAGATRAAQVSCGIDAADAPPITDTVAATQISSAHPRPRLEQAHLSMRQYTFPSAIEIMEKNQQHKEMVQQEKKKNEQRALLHKQLRGQANSLRQQAAEQALSLSHARWASDPCYANLVEQLKFIDMQTSANHGICLLLGAPPHREEIYLTAKGFMLQASNNIDGFSFADLYRYKFFHLYKSSPKKLWLTPKQASQGCSRNLQPEAARHIGKWTSDDVAQALRSQPASIVTSTQYESLRSWQLDKTNIYPGLLMGLTATTFGLSPIAMFFAAANNVRKARLAREKYWLYQAEAQQTISPAEEHSARQSGGRPFFST